MRFAWGVGWIAWGVGFVGANAADLRGQIDGICGDSWTGICGVVGCDLWGQLDAICGEIACDLWGQLDEIGGGQLDGIVGADAWDW